MTLAEGVDRDQVRRGLDLKCAGKFTSRRWQGRSWSLKGERSGRVDVGGFVSIGNTAIYSLYLTG